MGALIEQKKQAPSEVDEQMPNDITVRINNVPAMLRRAQATSVAAEAAMEAFQTKIPQLQRELQRDSALRVSARRDQVRAQMLEAVEVLAEAERQGKDAVERGYSATEEIDALIKGAVEECEVVLEELEEANRDLDGLDRLIEEEQNIYNASTLAMEARASKWQLALEEPQEEENRGAEEPANASADPSALQRLLFGGEDGPQAASALKSRRPPATLEESSAPAPVSTDQLFAEAAILQFMPNEVNPAKEHPPPATLSPLSRPGGALALNPSHRGPGGLLAPSPTSSSLAVMRQMDLGDVEQMLALMIADKEARPETLQGMQDLFARVKREQDQTTLQLQKQLQEVKKQKLLLGWKRDEQARLAENARVRELHSDDIEGLDPRYLEEQASDPKATSPQVSSAVSGTVVQRSKVEELRIADYSGSLEAVLATPPPGVSLDVYNGRLQANRILQSALELEKMDIKPLSL